MSEKPETRGRADNIDKLVSRRIKMRRMMLGLSQHDLGKAVDVSIQQIQKYEKATNRISSGKLYTLARFLKPIFRTKLLAKIFFASVRNIFLCKTKKFSS